MRHGIDLILPQPWNLMHKVFILLQNIGDYSWELFAIVTRIMADVACRPIPVLLLKTKSIPVDGYDEYFKTVENGKYNPIFVPVLEHRFKADVLDWLSKVVNSQGLSTNKHPNPVKATEDTFGGMIFTSQRAVEAFSNTIQSLDASARDLLLPAEFPLYVVGPATAKGLRALGLKCPIIGEETGNGEALAAFMLDDYNRRQEVNNHGGGTKLPLLFLVGEQRRDIIPKTLQSSELPDGERITVVEKTVYETGEMQSFRSDFSSLIRSNASQGLQEQWVVVFSPTGCEAMLRALNWLDEEQRYDSRLGESSFKGTHIATIGPTTRDYLLKEFSFQPHTSADKPSAEGIGSAIQTFVAKH